MLLCSAVIWGLSFVAQSVGMESVESFTFNGIRTLLGSFVLIPLILFREKKAVPNDKSLKKRENKSLLKAGFSCGILLFFATNIQQFAFKYTTVGKIGFITALYMIIVPIIGIFMKKRVRNVVWFCAALGSFGLYLLCCGSESFSFGYGESLTLICAIIFAIHILIIDHFAPFVDNVKLSSMQFLVSGTLSIICMFIFEKPNLPSIISVWPAILYTGIMSCGVAYTFQIVGQKHTDPSVASILLCFESVFAVIFGWMILNETLTTNEIIGCLLMFAAIIIAQLPERKKVKISAYEKTT